MADKVDDVAGNVALGRAGDADRLVERDIDATRRMFGIARAALHALAVDADLIAFIALRAEFARLVLDRHSTGRAQRVGFPPRAQEIGRASCRARGWPNV